MKSIYRFILNVLLLVFIIGIVDFTAGKALSIMWKSIPLTQDMGKAQFGRNNVDAQLLVIGSSRASHHYNVNKMIKEWEVSAYNLGLDACLFLDNCCMMNAIFERYTPHFIILEIQNDALFYETVNYYQNLYFFYDTDNYTKNIINHEEGWEIKIKLMSNLYKFNNNSLRIIGYGLSGLRNGFIEDPLHGYAPLEYKEKLKELKLVVNKSNVKEYSLSRWKCSLLDNLLATASKKGVKVLLVSSPVYALKNKAFEESEQAIKKICIKNGFEYWDYSCDTFFLNHPEWFVDVTHLNDIGAEIFTDLIIKRINLYYK